MYFPYTDIETEQYMRSILKLQHIKEHTFE